MVDTIKRGADGLVKETVAREQLYTVQTPQGFHFDELLAAHEKYQGEALTDDAALMEKLGIPVALVEGDIDNSKITSQTDLTRMRTAYFSNTMETRTGMGFDVHQLKLPRSWIWNPIVRTSISSCAACVFPPCTGWLGIPMPTSACMRWVDAILGTISNGDIGTHFPPDDPKWQGANSERFLLKGA